MDNIFLLDIVDTAWFRHFGSMLIDACLEFLMIDRGVHLNFRAWYWFYRGNFSTLFLHVSLFYDEEDIVYVF